MIPFAARAAIKTWWTRFFQITDPDQGAYTASGNPIARRMVLGTDLDKPSVKDNSWPTGNLMMR